MSPNPQEQSEAKLLAYIEGELDPAERAEIEKHLESNPHHRRMMDELARTRDLVRYLPRESAPADLMEAFQGQLERQELLANDLHDLGDDEPAAGAEAPEPIRIPFWHRVRAVAAVLLVGAGVATVVYLATPKPGGLATGGDPGKSGSPSTQGTDGKFALGTEPDSGTERRKEGGVGEVGTADDKAK